MLSVVSPVWGDYARFVPLMVQQLVKQKIPCTLILMNGTPISDIDRQRLDNAHIEIVFVDVQPGHIGQVRNRMTNYVTSEYVVFHDVDDAVVPGNWLFLLSRLDSRPELVSATGANLRVNERGEYAVQYRPWYTPLVRYSQTLAIWMQTYYNLFVLGSAAVHRTKAVQAAGGFAEAGIAEDTTLGLSLALVGPVEWHRRWGRVWYTREGSLWHQAHNRVDTQQEWDIRRQRLSDLGAHHRLFRLLNWRLEHHANKYAQADLHPQIDFSADHLVQPSSQLCSWVEHSLSAYLPTAENNPTADS